MLFIDPNSRWRRQKMKKYACQTVIILSLTLLVGLWSAIACLDPGSDEDDDGLTLKMELALGTNPCKPDTDRDNIPDGGDPDILRRFLAVLPEKVFKGNGLRLAMMARLDEIERWIQCDKVERAVDGLEKLRRHVEGCPPKAGANDWITSCSWQVKVRDIIDILMSNHFSYQVDTSVRPSRETIPGLSGEPDRPVAVAMGPNGQREEFVLNEVVVNAGNRRDLDRLLRKYGGKVIRDGTPQLLEGGEIPPGLPPSTGWYLIEVDPALSSLTDLSKNMEAVGLHGKWTFSSEDAARMSALLARERAFRVSPNMVGNLQQTCTVCEHPASNGSNLDAALFWWMTEDDDPKTPDDQGLSIGVLHAWDYLKYKGYPPLTPYAPVILAIIDSGFDVDGESGLPVTGAPDYPAFRPQQIDMVDNDRTADGKTGGWSNDPGWHGQMTFGVACAVPSNYYGTAGISGGETTPLLIKTPADLSTVADSVYAAVYNHADVISMSISCNCGYWCRVFEGGNKQKAAVQSAKNRNVIVVAAAGNDHMDLSDQDMIPCGANGAVCVGAIDGQGQAKDYSNWGNVVDIWAPAGIFSTVTRDSAAGDSDDLDWDELKSFEGTSCSTPFVAGAVALMKMLDRDLTYDETRSILWDTANPGDFPKVSNGGYVDVFRAVEAVRPNQVPSVQITQPPSGSTVSYTNRFFATKVIDPELTSSNPYAGKFRSSVAFISNIDGELCTSEGNGPVFTCEATSEMTPGNHIITARAVDAFKALGTSTTAVNYVNSSPTAKITSPANGSTFYTSQLVNLAGYAFDSDEPIYYMKQVAWESSLDGNLGQGFSMQKKLTEGEHVITFKVTDSLGATGTDSISVTVKAGDGYPSVHIIEPDGHHAYGSEEGISFLGKGTDPEDGDLTGDSLKWFSDIDGEIGTGEFFTRKLSISTESTVHVITLKGTDSDGHLATHSISITVMDLH
jgi:hypothetical protein